MSNWLTIIGVGEKGVSDLGADAEALIEKAEIIVGSARLFECACLNHAEKHLWSSPLSSMIETILGWRGRPVVVLATGDPMHFGIGATMSRYLAASEFSIIPAQSAFSLAASRLRWPLQSVCAISLHGRPVETILQHLEPGHRILALTSGASTVRQVAELLVEKGYGLSILTILEHMDGDDERTISLMAREAVKVNCAEFNTLSVDCVHDGVSPILCNIPGLPDDAFTHQGKITKSEVRAITLSALYPITGSLLWDVGAGSGSVAIEWLRSSKGMSAIAFESDEEQIQFIKTNARNLGTPNLSIIEGVAPDSFDGQPSPDAVFVGGGILHDNLIETCWDRLNSGGRLVANVVTLEGERAVYEHFDKLGGEVIRIDIAKTQPVGTMHGMKPRMAVTQWRVTKSAGVPS